MRTLFYNKNNYLKENHFSTLLKIEIKNKLSKYYKRYIPVPLEFEEFDQDITKLIIDLQDKVEIEKEKQRKIKCYTTYAGKLLNKNKAIK